MIEGADFFVRVVDFPPGAGSDGMTILNSDGTYSVYINARAGLYAQKKAMRHEYGHMANDDLYGDRDIRSVEEKL